MPLSLKWLMLAGALTGFISVAAGAFGAHLLKNKLSSEMLSVFEIGVRYQIYHAFAIFAAIFVSTLLPGSLPPLAGWLFFLGMLIFSGSLYALSLSGLKFFGAITPIGGVFLLAGWFCLGLAAIRSIVAGSS